MESDLREVDPGCQPNAVTVDFKFTTSKNSQWHNNIIKGTCFISIHKVGLSTLDKHFSVPNLSKSPR